LQEEFAFWMLYKEKTEVFWDKNASNIAKKWQSSG